MMLIEAESFKINLINHLNNQRVDGTNCDIEINSSNSTCKIYTHSIILNLFSDILKSFITDRMKSMAVCKITFPDEIDFIKTDCFDCFKQVINYFYAGELKIDPQHEIHLKNIVFNLKIERLMELLYSSFEESEALPDCRTFDSCNKSILEVNRPPTGTSLQLIPSSYSSQTIVSPCENLNEKNMSDDIKNTEVKKNGKLFESVQDTDDSTNTIEMVQESKILVTSPPKKRLRGNYEKSINNALNTCSKSSEKNYQTTNQMHADGLHLLLSILEKENKTEFLASKPNLNATSEKHYFLNEVNNYYGGNQQDDLPKKLIVENCEPKNPQDTIIYQALISKQHNGKMDHDNILHMEGLTLDNKVSEQREDSKRKKSGTQKKRKINENQERGGINRKSRSLKKKENHDKVIGVQDGYMCKKCKMFFDNLSSLQEHIQSTHSKKFRCIACEFMTINICNFIDHLIQNRHEGTICSICHFQTSTNEELHRHIARHKQNLPKPFFCNECDKTFPTRRSWSVHLPVHSNETQFLCAVCSKGFKWSQGLQNHMSTHVNEKLYLCSQCDFHTASRANLAKHTLKHDTKKEVCPHEECKHREIRRENLKAHLLTHSKVKRFQCELCGKSFAHARNLDRHLESVHNPRMIELSCNQCNYLSIRLDKLKDHFKSRHKTYDYTQYIEKLKENMKTRSLLGARVNRHILASTKKYNYESQVENGTFPFTLSQHQPIVCNNQTSTSILTLPVLNQDNLFRDYRVERSTTLPIIMNVNQMTAGTNLMRPLIKPIVPRTLPKNSVLDNCRMKIQKSKQTTMNTKSISCNRKRKKKQLKSEVKNNNFISSASTPKKILPLIRTPQSCQPNAPIYLIISSNTPKNQVIASNTNANVFQNGSGNRPMKLFLVNKLGQNQLDSKALGEGVGKETGIKDNTVNYTVSSCRNLDISNNTVNYVEPHTIHKNSLCFTDNETTSQHNIQKNKTEHHNNQGENLIHNTDVTKCPPTPAFPNPEQSRSGNYFDILDESTGELHLLTSKHINNPFLDEATGELSVFEIPSSFINYIENLTGSSEYDNILGAEPVGGAANDLTDYSYRDESFPLFLNEEHASSWSDNKRAAFILDELTGELNVTTK